MKGTGASYGFPIVSTIGAHMDAILKHYLHGARAVPPATLDHLQSYLQVLYECFDAIQADADDFTKLQSRVNQLEKNDPDHLI
jgi:hypothetical protein